MPCPFRLIISGLLPAAAALSLVVGPSPSAVSAEYRHRAQDQGIAHSQPVDAGSTPSSPSDEAQEFDIFVAPAAAKPAETKPTVETACNASYDCACETRPIIARIADRMPARPATSLHRPAYLATAPPRC